MPYTTNSSSSLTFVRHSIIESTTTIPLSTTTWIIDEPDSTDQPFVRIMWYRFLLVIVIFVTAIGNLLVCLAIARERKLQNTTNYFLMSLAIADCLVAILVMPMGMIAEVLGHFPLPDYACIIFATMDVLCCTSSIWHMSTMSMDRYFTIRFPFRYGRNKTRRIMLLKIIAVWAISVAVSSPVFVLGIYDKKNVLSEGTCAPNNAFFKIYGSIFAFYIPFIIMIITYALTMRSLRNVLVNKKKYDRERRRKQTFRPLAQIINQYAEIAQGIRRTSSAKKSVLSTSLANNNHSNSILNKTPFTIITTTSPTDSRAQFFSSNNNNVNLQQENGSINLVNGTNVNNELIHHNSQHLTISYVKPSGSKKRRYQQQQQQQVLTTNTTINRTKNDVDMSTVYEITENSRSTSSSYEVSTILTNNFPRRSIVSCDQQSLRSFEKIEQSLSSNPITTVISDISTLKEEEPGFTSDLDSEISADPHESLYMQIGSSSSQYSSLSHPNESIFLSIPWECYSKILQYILQYYTIYFPYRLHPLAIEYPSNSIEKPLQFNQSTSTSSIYLISSKNCRTISTQTNPYSTLDSNNNNHHHSTTINEHLTHNPTKRRKFPFNRPLLPAASLLTNLFRQSPSTPVRSSGSSTKSSLSWGQRSSAASSSNQMRPPYSFGTFRRIESEAEPVLSNDRRSRASTSSSGLLHTTYHHGSYAYTHYHKPLARQQYQSRSAYVLAHSPKSRSQHHQQLSSATNTNSSDSSSIIHRYHSRLLSTVSQQQRVRDEDIVAANERKALRVLMIIFCVFVTLWTPFFICTFISAICEDCRDRISPSVWFSITWLGYCSSMANPFIYTIFSDVFRRAFINIIFCRPKDSFMSGQYSTKLSHPKGDARQYTNQHVSYRRSPNPEISGPSTPVPLHQPTPINGNDAMIYRNRCASDSFR